MAVNAGRQDSNSNSRFRHRKISVKQRLRIYQPTDLKNLDRDELKQREVVEVETGVEKNEEKEVHLHRILQKGSAQINPKKKDYIPTPDASNTWRDFDKFYQGKFVEPTSYIKFSATVEDCCGASYNMDEVDEKYLIESVNSDSKEGDESFLTEDEFETLCTAFETAIHERQPFLSMDPESILTFEEIKPTLLKVDFGESQLRSNLSEEIGYKNEKFLTQFDSPSQINARPLAYLIENFGSTIYDYWKERKINANGSEIFPQLKFERPGEKEEVDPYVCFRRREVRHPRKTRRIDIINSQKLRLLHLELVHAKEMALLVAKREFANKKTLESDLSIFTDRIKMKELKRKLNISGEDEDLVHHKRKRASLITVEKRRQIEKEEALAAKNAIATAAAAAESLKKSKTKLSRKQLEQLAKSGEKLTKQQMLQLQSSKVKSETKTKQVHTSQAQVQPPQPSISSHVYVKLPSSKIPDLVLEDVDNLLAHKEKNARRFVQERMEKRKQEDSEHFFNLTDDPYNPIFNLSLPKSISPSDAPFTSIASSKFEVDKSYYMSDIMEYLKGTTNDIDAFNKQGEKLPSNENKFKKLEIYDPFQANGEIHSREYPFMFRKRIGRANIRYIDRKPNDSSLQYNGSNSESVLNDFIDFDAIEKEEYNNPNKTINVYDSKADELTRLHDRWKYDSPRNDYGIKFSKEPSRLNQISADTQVIRFGTMLGSKSYEQLRKATVKYRREYIIRLKQLKINAEKQQQLQQQQQNQLNSNNSNSSSSIASKTGTPNSNRKNNNEPNIKNESNGTPTPIRQSTVPVSQKKSF